MAAARAQIAALPSPRGQATQATSPGEALGMDISLTEEEERRRAERAKRFAPRPASFEVEEAMGSGCGQQAQAPPPAAWGGGDGEASFGGPAECLEDGGGEAEAAAASIMDYILEMEAAAAERRGPDCGAEEASSAPEPTVPLAPAALTVLQAAPELRPGGPAEPRPAGASGGPGPQPAAEPRLRAAAEPWPEAAGEPRPGATAGPRLDAPAEPLPEAPA
ncbi:unnamed protein product [Prorocentrum cordatum]|uniref:Uncharacterized protein n=1 Tax=Prorocentrum cordatum TaxID=2364126 RepID=A0ABN9TAV7_9DINO|nr:unnamed protein product [Polarella glacialis]